jgi:hypothetical protein
MARSFNGTSDYLASASALTLGVARIAVSFWINTTFAADDDILLELSSNSNSTAGTFKIITNESGSDKLWVDALGNVGKVAADWTAPTTSAWHHMVVNFGNNPTVGEVESLYIDGNLWTTGEDAPIPNSDNTGTFSDQILYVMSRGGTALFADGSMADLCIWAPSSEISGTDVINLAAGRRANTVRASEILYYWPLAGTTSPEPAAVGSIPLTVNGAASASDPPTLDAISGGGSSSQSRMVLTADGWKALDRTII